MLNYSSKHGSKQDLSIIMKCVPEVFNFKKDFLERCPLFKVEMKMYGGVLDEMADVWRSVGDNVMVIPK